MKAKFYLPTSNINANFTLPDNDLTANFNMEVMPDFRTFAKKEELIAETETRAEQDDILDRKIDDVAASIPDFSDLATKDELTDEAGTRASQDNLLDQKIDDVAASIPDTSSFASKDDLDDEADTRTAQDTLLDQKIDDVANQIPDISNLATKTELQTVENEIPDITGLVDLTTLTQILLNYYTKNETYTKAEVQALIASIPQFRVQIVQSLPASGERMVLYLVPKTGSSPDVYNEYVWIEDDEEYELIGNTAVDLTGYAKESWVLNQGYLKNSTDIVSALGFTPYSAANPNHYTNNIGTVTAVNNSQPDANGNVTISIPDISNLVSNTQLSTTLAGYVSNSALSTTLASYPQKSQNENITALYTFIGTKKLAFKQSSASDKLGFTLYTNNGTEKGYLEFNPSNTIDGAPLMTLGNYASSAAAITHVGFRKYSSVSGASGAYNLLAPLISEAKTPFSLTTTYKNFYLPLGFKYGNNTVLTSKSGVCDLSEIFDTSIKIGNTTLTESQLQSLLALI